MQPLISRPRPAPLDLADVEEALRNLRNLRAGRALGVQPVGPTEIGKIWTARLSLLAAARSDWQKHPAYLRVWYPAQRCKTAQVAPADLERKHDRPVMVGLTDAAIERAAPKIHRYLLGQQEQICPMGFLYRDAATELRYVVGWPGEGWQVRLTEEQGWISARLLEYHPDVIAAVEEAERIGRAAYIHEREGD